MKKPSKYVRGESRREALRTLAVAAGGAALGGYVPGCTSGVDFPDPSDAGADARARDAALPDAGPDAALPDAAALPADAATASPDAANPDAAQDAAAPDAAAGEPDLVPLRGDGSHPFHYIDTLIIVQMENRSFDHFFGSLSLVEGRDDVEGLRPGITNPTSDGRAVAPAPLGDVYAVSPDPGHGHGSTMDQWNDGACDGFVRDFEGRVRSAGADPAQAEWVMGYYTRRELPISYGLAEAFTLCDHWHCGMRGPTWPNRYFSHCASSGGLTANNGLCSEPTPYTALAEAGGSYRVYYTSLYFLLTITSVPQKNAFKMDKFFADCEAGTLANVNIVEPSFLQNDDHPPADVRNGQAFIATIYEAIRRSPQWNRCLMVVFYDEHGGFHDHVNPPESQGDPRGGEAFGRFGFRIPGLVIGPLVKRGHVFHEVLDHSSVPGLISRVFDLDHVNDRSRLAGDFAGALDLSLVQGANRPPAPALAPMQLPEDALDNALYADLHQPELETWFRKMGMAHQASLPERRRLMRNYLLNAKKLGAVRFT